MDEEPERVLSPGARELSWAVVGVFALRLLEYLFVALRQCACTERKVIVMSCPEMGTLCLSGRPPYDQHVMDKVAELQRRKRLKMGFDRAGSSTQHPEDRDVNWSDAEQIRRSRWMYGFVTAAKAQLKLECQSFDGIVVVVCIKGGPVTDVEHDMMDSIIADATSDAERSGVTCRIERRNVSYVEFLREYDEGWVCRCARSGKAGSAATSGQEEEAKGRRKQKNMALAAPLLHDSDHGFTVDDEPELEPELEPEPEPEHASRPVVWVRDFDDNHSLWVRGEVEGYNETSGAPLVRAGPDAKPRVWRIVATAPPGLHYHASISDVCTWSRAVDVNGFSAGGALLRGMGKALFWHIMQPVLYFYVFFHAYPELEPLQQGLGCAVAVREVLYVLLVLACVCRRPAFLLIDLGTSVRHGVFGSANNGMDFTFLAMYVIAAEKFICSVLFREDQDRIIAVFLFGSGFIDLFAVAALGAGFGAANLPPALSVGYGATALGALWGASAWLVFGVKKCHRTALPGGLLLTACLLCAFLVPLELSLPQDDGSQS